MEFGKNETESSIIFEGKQGKEVFRSESLPILGEKIFIETEQQTGIGKVYLDETKTQQIGELKNPLNHKKGVCYEVYKTITKKVGKEEILENKLLGWHCLHMTCEYQRTLKPGICYNDRTGNLKKSTPTEFNNAFELIVDNYKK
ncbi:MAG: hypothetical protein AB7V77_01400 [Candidatus Woesearchaeota archaeon]